MVPSISASADGPIRAKVFLGLCLVFGLTIVGCSPPVEVNVVATVDQAEPYVPGPWVELSRVPSPDGQIEAVITSRPTDGPYGRDYPPTNLYLVPQGTIIPRQAPVPPSTGKLSRIRLKRDAPFIGYEIKGITVKWKDGSSVLLDVHEGMVHNHEDSKQVILGNESRTVGIEYIFRNCYSGESPQSRPDLKPI